MRYLVFLVFFVSFSAKAQLSQHCGFDFTSYFVLNVHEAGKTENIKGLKISIVNALGIEIVNTNNLFSWTNANKPLVFSLNYKIDAKGNKISLEEATEKDRWFFPFAKDHYLLSIKNTFPAEDYSVKIEDIDGIENGGEFQTQIVKLASYNMYVLCSGKAREVQFGPKINRPLNIVLQKK